MYKIRKAIKPWFSRSIGPAGRQGSSIFLDSPLPDYVIQADLPDHAIQAGLPDYAIQAGFSPDRSGRR